MKRHPSFSVRSLSTRWRWTTTPRSASTWRRVMRCQSELAQFHEVAGLLANAGGDAPQHVWDRIAEQVGTTGTQGAAAQALVRAVAPAAVAPAPVA